MADESKNEEKADGEPKKKSSGLIIWLAVCVASIGTGFAVPFFMSPGKSDDGESDISQVSDEPPVFVDFGEVVVNLNEPRLNRYLRLKISLMVDADQKSEVDDKVTKNKTNLISWLLSFLADKRMDDIRGGTGQNRLRNEIRNHFNAVLFPDGFQHVRGVLFEEFNIQ